MPKFSQYFVIAIIGLVNHNHNVHAASPLDNRATTIATPSTVKYSSVTGFIVDTPPREGLTKRAVAATVTDLNQSAAVAKSYDPPPEFYRGPGSTSSSTASSAYGNRDSIANSLITKPIAFPNTSERNKYGQDNSNYLSNAYESWKQLKGGYGRNPIQDRISVGHYGSPDHGSHGGSTGGYSGSTGGYSGSTGGYGGSYTYSGGRPSYASAGGGGVGGVGVGGGGHHIEYVPHYAGGGGGSGGYYGSGESIPFDLYNKGGHYAGEGGEYSYTTYPVGSDGHEATHKGYPELSQKALLAKSFLIPLASAAVLGIAAALVSNPLLLQLGTVSGVAPAVVGKRKRRAVQETAERPNTAKATGSAQRIAYRGYRIKKGVPQESNVGSTTGGGGGGGGA